MQKKILKRKTSIFFIAISCVFLVFFSFLFNKTNFTTFAIDNSELSFDSTDPYDDLVATENFDIANYPRYESEKPEMHMIHFVEYCYSYYNDMNDNFGLYIYLYNPNMQNINVSSSLNKIMLAVKYDTSPVTSNSKPTDYEKFDLEFCSASQAPDYKNLFYKFKIVDHTSADGTTILKRVNNQARRYDVGEIELLTKGNRNATAYGVTGLYATTNPEHKSNCYGTFTFTGYAKGYGEDENNESTLSCKISYLESVSLDVKHTFYRTQTSSKGAGYQYQLNSVYFSVPKRFFNNYGYLQKIKAEWYEYKTKDILVTSNLSFYSAIEKNIGRSFSGTNAEAIEVGYGVEQIPANNNTPVWNWNPLDSKSLPLYYAFYANNISSYDPYADIVSNGGITSNALYDYIESYNTTNNSGFLPIKNGKLNADLFTEDIDDYRKVDNEYGKIQQGYSYYDFDAKLDLQKMETWSGSDPSFSDNVSYLGFWRALFEKIPEEENILISPIHIIDKSDMTGSNDVIAQKLYIQSSDVPKLREVYDDAITVDKSDENDEEEVVVLFHFATSDYYSASVNIIDFGDKEVMGNVTTDEYIKNAAYRAWQSVFFNFDIIQLTFNKDGVYTVIPVVSNPIDIVNPITPPVNNKGNGDDDWKIILYIILACFLLIILLQTGILPLIMRVVTKIILFPFKLVAIIVDTVSNNSNKNKKE